MIQNLLVIAPLAFSPAMAVPSATSGPRHAEAAARTAEIHIDGQLSESDWQEAPVNGSFWQREPNEGQPPELQTTFQVVYDDEALYVAVRAFDDSPEDIRALLTRRDQDSASDWIMVALDSYHDQRTAFVFGLNAAGVQRDLMIYDDTNEDSSWDAVWAGAAHIDDEGWSAEFRIPYNQLRYPADTDPEWGLQVVRVVHRTREQTFWSPSPRDKPQLVSRFGTLEGVHDLPDAARLELMPYVVGGSRFSQPDPASPFDRGLDPALNGGLDLSYGLASNLTLAASINPDFGQVEADPSEVNLTASETYFQEKRPLFLEDADLFRFSLGQGDNNAEQLFYSRRIGAPPSVSPDAEFVDRPERTTILGAAKLSGKTASGWSVGVLDAVTAREEARLAGDGLPRRSEVVEPLTNYTVLQLQRDLAGGRTKVALAYTGVHRQLQGTHIDSLHTRAYAGGLRLSHRFADDEWMVNARLLASRVEGSRAAIDRTQRSSQHYFQRPDADHIDYDPNRTQLSGLGAVADVGRYGGKHWRGATGLDARTPGFEVNDLGFQRGADYVVNWGWLQYREDAPGRHHLNYQINTNVWTSSDWSQHLGAGGNVNATWNAPSYWGLHGGVGIDGSKWNTGMLRGGPAVRGVLGYNGWWSAWTDSRRPLQLGADGSFDARPEAGSWSNHAGVSASLQATSSLRVSVGPTWSRRIDADQYVARVEDPSGETAYILGRIDQTTVGLTARASYTVSPRLSLQLYAQPFSSSGAYDRFKRAGDVDAPRYADRFDSFSSEQVSRNGDVVEVDSNSDGTPDLSFGRPDFNFRELNASFVARWEFRPGSTLFFVWSHERTGLDTRGDFELSDELRGLRRAEGAHAVLVKLSWWFGT